MGKNGSISIVKFNDRAATLQGNNSAPVDQDPDNSGGSTEERIADRIFQQSEDLKRLMTERLALLNRD